MRKAKGFVKRVRRLLKNDYVVSTEAVTVEEVFIVNCASDDWRKTRALLELDPSARREAIARAVAERDAEPSLTPLNSELLERARQELGRKVAVRDLTPSDVLLVALVRHAVELAQEFLALSEAQRAQAVKKLLAGGLAVVVRPGPKESN